MRSLREHVRLPGAPLDEPHPVAVVGDRESPVDFARRSVRRRVYVNDRRSLSRARLDTRAAGDRMRVSLAPARSWSRVRSTT